MKTPTLTFEFHEFIGRRIEAEADDLARRWFERLKRLLPVRANEVFPSQELLDHVPELLREIGVYLRAAEQEEIGANGTVIKKASELGTLRHRQAASVHQLLREYEILGDILRLFVADETAGLPISPAPGECLAAIGRIQRSVHILMQTTVDTFIAAYTATIDEQTKKLESFNRTVSHELRNPLNTLGYALALLKMPEISGSERTGVVDLACRNVNRMRDLLGAISSLTRATAADDSPAVQRIEVGSIAREVARQLETMAAARGVTIRVGRNLPALTVEPARLELVLLNLVSNGIKYSDPAKPERFVEIEGEPGEDGAGVRIAVRDNGLGIAPEAQRRLFSRFFRAHAARDGELGNDGLGLGLSIVQENVQTLGGAVSVESAEGVGTTFTLELPERGQRPA